LSVTVGHSIVHDPTASELALLPADEREREFGSGKRRQQFLCARSLLRRMLQDWTGAPAASHQLTTTAEGKPVCLDGPAISITHSGDRIACSIAGSGAIGVDVEVTDDRRDTLKLARKFFSAEESNWLDTQPQDRFLMLWVLKEAYVKAIGRSIFGGINRLVCKVVPPDIDVIGMNDPMRQVSLYKTADGFLALAATTVSLADVSIKYWDSNAGELVVSENVRLLAMSEDLAKQYAS
jgi:4'-phosphopantetheinyl transferase